MEFSLVIGDPGAEHQEAQGHDDEDDGWSRHVVQAEL